MYPDDIRTPEDEIRLTEGEKINDVNTKQQEQMAKWRKKLWIGYPPAADYIIGIHPEPTSCEECPLRGVTIGDVSNLPIPYCNFMKRLIPMLTIMQTRRPIWCSFVEGKEEE